jgi:hypothetical protein
MWKQLVLVLLLGACARASTIHALSCSQSDVQTAINAAQDGDTVRVPAGSSSWTSGVIADLRTVPRSLVLKGAGSASTVIIDEVNPRTSMLVVTTAAGHFFRLSGFAFQGSDAVRGAHWRGAVVVNGDAKTMRIDSCAFRFNNGGLRAIEVGGYVFGVIDHNTFDGNVQAITVFHDAWGGAVFGDGSWASPLSLGSNEAIFFEDNVVTHPSSAVSAAVDGWSGARYVVRHNQFMNGWVDNHGTETSQRYRGIFSWEVYDNQFLTTPGITQYCALDVRGGTGVFANNVMSADVYNVVVLNTYRSFDSFLPFGACDGSSPYDISDGIVYDSGSFNGAAGSDVLTDNTKNWSANAWVGYSLRNGSQQWGSMITGNTQNTITVHPSSFITRTWAVNDTYRIVRVTTCLDQVGRSTGDMITGGGFVMYDVLPAAWPHQVLEPVYVWGNTKTGTAANTVSVQGYTIQRNREYYQNVARPGYHPYCYPHPLVSGEPCAPSAVESGSIVGVHSGCFPNPVRDVIAVALEGTLRAEEASIVDVLGRRVAGMRIDNGATTVHLSLAGLPRGIYTLEVRGSRGSRQMRFVRE